MSFTLRFERIFRPEIVELRVPILSVCLAKIYKQSIDWTTLSVSSYPYKLSDSTTKMFLHAPPTKILILVYKINDQSQLRNSNTQSAVSNNYIRNC